MWIISTLKRFKELCERISAVMQRNLHVIFPITPRAKRHFRLLTAGLQTLYVGDKNGGTRKGLVEATNPRLADVGCESPMLAVAMV